MYIHNWQPVSVVKEVCLDLVVWWDVVLLVCTTAFISAMFVAIFILERTQQDVKTSGPLVTSYVPAVC